MNRRDHAARTANTKFNSRESKRDKRRNLLRWSSVSARSARLGPTVGVIVNADYSIMSTVAVHRITDCALLTAFGSPITGAKMSFLVTSRRTLRITGVSRTTRKEPLK